VEKGKKLSECCVKCRPHNTYLYQFTQSNTINSYLIIRNQWS